MNTPLKMMSLGVAVAAVFVLAGCATNSTRPNTSSPAPSIAATGDPARGELPVREDGSIKYDEVTMEYAQAETYLEAFRVLFPDFGDEYFVDGGDAALRSVKEVCGSVYYGGVPSEMIDTVSSLIAEDFPRAATDREATFVINAAINTTCPEYFDMKIGYREDGSLTDL